MASTKLFVGSSRRCNTNMKTSEKVMYKEMTKMKTPMMMMHAGALLVKAWGVPTGVQRCFIIPIVHGSFKLMKRREDGPEGPLPREPVDEHGDGRV